jgi:hypothetical protein
VEEVEEEGEVVAEVVAEVVGEEGEEEEAVKNKTRMFLSKSLHLSN